MSRKNGKEQKPIIDERILGLVAASATKHKPGSI